MNSLLRRRIFRQFIKFGLVGITSTIIDWSVYLVLTRFFGIFYIVAKILSFLLAVINAYTLNRRWTFRSSDPQRIRQFSKFLVVSTISLVLNALIMALAVEKIHLIDIYGLVLATVIVMFWNFTANKFYTFKNQ